MPRAAGHANSEPVVDHLDAVEDVEAIVAHVVGAVIVRDDANAGALVALASNIDRTGRLHHRHDDQRESIAMEHQVLPIAAAGVANDLDHRSSAGCDVGRAPLRAISAASIGMIGGVMVSVAAPAPSPSHPP